MRCSSATSMCRCSVRRVMRCGSVRLGSMASVRSCTTLRACLMASVRSCTTLYACLMACVRSCTILWACLPLMIHAATTLNSMACIRAIGCEAASTVIPSSTLVDKAMSAPAVIIAPACPRPHSEEDAVVEVSRPVEAHRRAGVWRIVVIAIRAHRLDSDADRYLRVCGRRHGSNVPRASRTAASFDLDLKSVISPRMVDLLEVGPFSAWD